MQRRLSSPSTLPPTQVCVLEFVTGLLAHTTVPWPHGLARPVPSAGRALKIPFSLLLVSFRSLLCHVEVSVVVEMPYSLCWTCGVSI